MKIKLLIDAVLLLAAVTVKASQLYNPETYSIQPIPSFSPTTATPPVIPTSPQQIIPSGATPFDTNGLDFTNVTFKVGTGLINVPAGEAGYIQVDADLWALKNVDIGFSGNTTLGAYNQGFRAAGADVALFKNLSNFQLAAKVGIFGNFQDEPGIGGEAGVDLNYNLTAGTGWGFLGSSSGNFTYCFAGVKVLVPKFKFASNGSTFEKQVTAGVGYAF